MTKKLHTFTITVSAPAWLSRRDCKREVRTLINEQTVYGTRNTREAFVEIDFGDIKVRGIEDRPPFYREALLALRAENVGARAHCRDINAKRVLAGYGPSEDHLAGEAARTKAIAAIDAVLAEMGKAR